jgi:hypothetical protein
MKFYEVEQTWICQLGKTVNRTMLESYIDRNDKSQEEFVRFYFDVIKALKNTPAWGVSGVNKMINELTDSVRATVSRAKKGKSSAPAQAKKLLNHIDFRCNEEAEAKYNGRHKLQPLLTVEELNQLLTGAAA